MGWAEGRELEPSEASFVREAPRVHAAALESEWSSEPFQSLFEPSQQVSSRLSSAGRLLLVKRH